MSKMKRLFSHSATMKSRPPSGPLEYVHVASNCLEAVTNEKKDPREQAKAMEDLAKSIRDIKEILYGDTEKFPNADLGVQVTQEIFKGDFFSLLVRSIPLLDFDTRKDASQIVANLQRQKVLNRMVASDYLADHTELLDLMILGYENPGNQLFYGSMLKDCIRHQAVAKYILDCPLFPKFFQYMELPNFEVSSDAATTFKELLTRHKSTVADFLNRKFDSFILEYTKLLESSTYITRRMAVKTLGDILLDRSNGSALKRYVGSKANLKVIMNMLKEPNKSIQVEALRILKVFVNNEAPSEVLGVLISNKEKLLRFLTEFKLDKEDEKFNTEKAQVVQAIMDLKEPPAPS